MTQSRHDDCVRIAGIDPDRSNMSRVLQPNVLPRLTGIGGPPHSVALIDSAADIADIARADIDDVWIGRRHRYRSNRSHALLIEDGLPNHAAIGGLPRTAAWRSQVINCRLSGNARYSCHASRAEGADLPPLNSRIKGRIVLLGQSRWSGSQACEES